MSENLSLSDKPMVSNWLDFLMQYIILLHQPINPILDVSCSSLDHRQKAGKVDYTPAAANGSSLRNEGQISD